MSLSTYVCWYLLTVNMALKGRPRFHVDSNYGCTKLDKVVYQCFNLAAEDSVTISSV